MIPSFAERYQLIVYSDNYYLWSGLRHLIREMGEPQLSIAWHNDLSSKSLFQLRETILNDASSRRWLVVTPDNRLREVQQILPSENVCVIRDTLTLKQFANHLRHPDFRRTIQKDAPLTRTEVSVCLLIIKGFSTVKIAVMMNKSPKTIYTHRRNAMVKFHCHTLAELHRKMHLMESRSLYLSS